MDRETQIPRLVAEIFWRVIKIYWNGIGFI